MQNNDLESLNDLPVRYTLIVANNKKKSIYPRSKKEAFEIMVSSEIY